MKQINRQRKRDFFIRIVFPTFLAVFLFVISLFMIFIPAFENSCMNDRRIMILELTHTAKSILSEFYNKYKQGELSEDTAKAEALRIIRDLRYGNEKKDYFWISDRVPVMIMHPFREELNGKPLHEYEDPNGKKLFVEFARIVNTHGGGYVDYLWQWKDDRTKIVPKLSYVTLFEPWNWIIGTGIYLEDVRTEIEALERNLIHISLAISLIVSLLLCIVTRQSMIIEKNRREAEDDLRESVKKYRNLLENNFLIKIVDDSALMLNNLFDLQERNRLACRLHRKKVESLEIARIFSSLADSTVRYVIEQSIKEIGEPRVPFAFIVFGSQGRKEQTLKTDQDNAIIFRDSQGESQEQDRAYFLRLGKLITDRLNSAGYGYCGGNNMASNPLWCKPLNEWKQTLYQWITESSAKSLLDINIFFDFRLLFGDATLSRELLDHIQELISRNRGFLVQLVETALLTKLPEDILGEIIVGLDKDAPKSFDIKAVMRMIVEFARIYSISNADPSRNTLERLDHAFHIGKLDADEYNRIFHAYSVLMDIRLKNQFFQISEGIETSNLIDPRLLELTDLKELKDAFKTIREVQKKISFLNKLNVS